MCALTAAGERLSLCAALEPLDCSSTARKTSSWCMSIGSKFRLQKHRLEHIHDIIADFVKSRSV